MKREKKLPRAALGVLFCIVTGCALADVIAPYPPDCLDRDAANLAPCWQHVLGTDPMGRDLLSLLLFGGRASLLIGAISGLISTGIAVVFGTVSGLCSERISDLMMRFTELLMSVPQMLLILFLQAIWGKTTILSLSLIIGCISWTQIAKVVRSEVRQIRQSEYVLAAKMMEGGFWYILWRHFLPAFLSSILFMVITNVGQAMIMESTLSFLGLGLPLDMVSWGTLLSMSQEAMLSGNWWILLMPGMVLVTSLTCVTSMGEYVRKKNTRLHSNL